LAVVVDKGEGARKFSVVGVTDSSLDGVGGVSVLFKVDNSGGGGDVSLRKNDVSEPGMSGTVEAGRGVGDGRVRIDAVEVIVGAGDKDGTGAVARAAGLWPAGFGRSCADSLAPDGLTGPPTGGVGVEGKTTVVVVGSPQSILIVASMVTFGDTSITTVLQPYKKINKKSLHRYITLP
jgi:hypothetical protein